MKENMSDSRKDCQQKYFGSALNLLFIIFVVKLDSSAISGEW